MTPLVFWLALACGIDAGYEPAPDGHLEYIIQIEPELVPTLATGHDIISEVPRGLDVRHYRLTVGTAVLPKNAAASGQAADSASEGIGGSEGIAEQSEPPGRLDEVISATTPQFRAAYQAWATGGGQVAIEIDPASLVDLNERDLTGDIRPGQTITRFVVSTRPGTVPDEIPAAWGGDVTPTRAAMAPTGETAAAPDGDPSPWKAQPQSGPGGPSAAPISTAAVPATAASGAVGAGPSGAGPSGIGPAATGGISSLGPPIAEEDPGGSEKAPAAMPPPSGQVVDPPSTFPLVGEPSNPTSHFDPPGNSYHQGGGVSGTGSNSGYASGAAGAPAPLPTGSAMGAPASGSGFNETTSREHQYGAKRPHDPQPAAVGEKHDNPAAKATGSNHTAPEPQTIPYLPLAVVTFGLIFSLGVNVFLGWHVWESYNRVRTAVHAPPAEKHHEKRHERKTSLAH